jgi:hypothetical protein
MERSQCQFGAIEQAINRMCDIAGVSLTVPRLNRTQRNRSNHPSDSPWQYYTRSIVIPLYDQLINQFDERFTELSKHCVLALKLLPSTLSSVTEADLTAVYSAYKSLTITRNIQARVLYICYQSQCSVKERS